MLSFSFSVFGYTPDTVFGIEGFAKGAVASSSVTAGIGICVDAWFLATYSSANAQKFKVRPAFPHSTRPRDHACILTLTRTGARHGRLLLILLLLHRVAPARLNAALHFSRGHASAVRHRVVELGRHRRRRVRVRVHGVLSAIYRPRGALCAARSEVGGLGGVVGMQDHRSRRGWLCSIAAVCLARRRAYVVSRSPRRSPSVPLPVDFSSFFSSAIGLSHKQHLLYIHPNQINSRARWVPPPAGH